MYPGPHIHARCLFISIPGSTWDVPCCCPHVVSCGCGGCPVAVCSYRMSVSMMGVPMSVSVQSSYVHGRGLPVSPGLCRMPRVSMSPCWCWVCCVPVYRGCPCPPVCAGCPVPTQGAVSMFLFPQGVSQVPMGYPVSLHRSSLSRVHVPLLSVPCPEGGVSMYVQGVPMSMCLWWGYCVNTGGLSVSPQGGPGPCVWGCPHP